MCAWIIGLCGFGFGAQPGCRGTGEGSNRSIGTSVLASTVQQVPNKCWEVPENYWTTCVRFRMGRYSATMRGMTIAAMRIVRA